jgi:hypothetical protein
MNEVSDVFGSMVMFTISSSTRWRASNGRCSMFKAKLRRLCHRKINVGIEARTNEFYYDDIELKKLSFDELIRFPDKVGYKKVLDLSRDELLEWAS